MKQSKEPEIQKFLRADLKSRIPYEKLMEKFTQKLVSGIFVVFVIIAAVVIVETLNGWQFSSRACISSALFSTVQDLKTGDQVKMAGVEIRKG